MKIYIAGKITGDSNYKQKFQEAETKLRNKGHSVMNPAWMNASPEFQWKDYIAVSMEMQKRCDAVLFLPDWIHSKGARKENSLALRLGQEMFFSIEDIPTGIGSDKRAQDSIGL